MGIQVESFKPFKKGTLEGFATLRLTNIGLEIRDVCLHQKNDKQWIQLPSKSYEKDGKTQWAYILDFFDKSKGDQFQRLALAALDEFLVKGKGGGNGF